MNSQHLRLKWHFEKLDNYRPWTSVESKTPRWAPETDPQWGPHHLDSHREKTTGTSGALTIWLCCSWNKLLIYLARGELPPGQRYFSPFCHRWSFGSLPLLPLACLVGDCTWLHRYYLNWTELDDGKCNNEMPSTDNWVFNLVNLHCWHTIFLFWYCAVSLIQFSLLKALYK